MKRLNAPFPGSIAGTLANPDDPGRAQGVALRTLPDPSALHEGNGRSITLSQANARRSGDWMVSLWHHP